MKTPFKQIFEKYRVCAIAGNRHQGKTRIRIASIDDDARRLRTDEGSRLLRRWEHTIEVEAIDEATSRYTDRLEIEAGGLTPLVGLFARGLFRWRHHRWRRLAVQLPSG